MYFSVPPHVNHSHPQRTSAGMWAEWACQHAEWAKAAALWSAFRSWVPLCRGLEEAAYGVLGFCSSLVAGWKTVVSRLEFSTFYCNVLWKRNSLNFFLLFLFFNELGLVIVRWASSQNFTGHAGRVHFFPAEVFLAFLLLHSKGIGQNSF